MVVCYLVLILSILVGLVIVAVRALGRVESRRIPEEVGRYRRR